MLKSIAFAAVLFPALFGIISAQSDYSLPDSTGAINVWDLGARGDDTLVDEYIIEKAIRDYQDGWRQIYLPEGTYYINGTIGDMDSAGQDPVPWDRFYTLRGAGRGKTIIKIRDNAPGFQDAANPKPVILCWNRVVRTDSPIPWEGVTEGNPDESNDCHSIYIMHMTIDVGDNNPGAVGLDYSSHNGGIVGDVDIIAGTNSGTIGLALNRKWPGPSLIKDVSITGFDCGIFLRYHNYSMTLENITLEGQREVGILHENHAGCIRKVTSHNSVPAVRNIGLQGMLVLLDCVFDGGSSSACAIDNSHGLFARNIKSEGYKSAIMQDSVVMTAFSDSIDEFITEPWRCAQDKSPRRSLGLEIKETPVPAWEDRAEWVNIEDYSGSVSGTDWTPAIEAAIADGATTIFLPNRSRYQTYGIIQPLNINGSLRQIIGLASSLSGGKIVVDNTDPSAVIVLEQVRFDTLEHRGAATLVLRGCMGSNITTFPGAGDLFFDDHVGHNMVFDHTNVWARQMNNESPGLKIHNKGGKLWILGYKNENPSTLIINTDGAQTEILGGQVYPVFEVADTVPMYINDESALSFIQTYNPSYIPDLPKYPYYVKEIFNGTEQHVDSTVADFTSYTKLKRLLYVSNPDSMGTGPDSRTSAQAPRAIARATEYLRPSVTSVKGAFVVQSQVRGYLSARLISANGRTVRSAADRQGSVTLSTEGLSAGVYSIDVRCGNGNAVTRVVLAR